MFINAAFVTLSFDKNCLVFDVEFMDLLFEIILDLLLGSQLSSGPNVRLLNKMASTILMSWNLSENCIPDFVELRVRVATFDYETIRGMNTYCKFAHVIDTWLSDAA